MATQARAEELLEVEATVSVGSSVKYCIYALTEDSPMAGGSVVTAV